MEDRARGATGFDHGEPEPDLCQLLADLVSQAEHQQNDGFRGAEEIFVCNVVVFHSGEIPNAKMAGVWDRRLLDGHPVRPLEDHVLEVGTRPSAKEAAQNVALDGRNELRFTNTCCPTHHELCLSDRHLSQHQL